MFQEMSWSKQPLNIPVERYITHLLEEVPFPEPTILLQASDKTKLIHYVNSFFCPFIISGYKTSLIQ